MTDISARTRQSAGQPTGGQFATEAKGTDTGVSLGAAEAPITVPDGGYQYHDDSVAAEEQARALAEAGHWAVVEHVHTYREDEVHDGMENFDTSTDTFEVQVFDTEDELLTYVEKGGYTQRPDGSDDDGYDTLEAEPYSDPTEPTVEERTLMVMPTPRGVDDDEQERVEHEYVAAAASMALNEEMTDTQGLSPDDIDPETREELVEELRDFIATNNPVITRLRAEHPDYPIDQFGTDFYLSRNGHGAGFFDRGLGEVGDTLQERARVYGEQSITADGEII